MVEVTTDKDTGWGVIYRLNNLFNEVESLAPSGKYGDWNFKLDRIWSNLMYREDLDIEYDEEKKHIIDVKFDEEAYEMKIFFDRRIAEIKKDMRLCKKNFKGDPSQAENSKEYIVQKNKLYSTILKKEIWLRKWMRELQLYLKEIVKDPSGAMWGS